MTTPFSERAQNLLAKPVAWLTGPSPDMRTYQHGDLKIDVSVEVEAGIVKKLSFYGKPPAHLQVLTEAMARLMVGKSLASITQISLRECEAYLRDRNSVAAIPTVGPEDESALLHFFSWLRFFEPKGQVQNYQFSSEKGPFQRLKLVEKIREIKAFLNSPKVAELYRDHHLPELVDVEDLTVYVDAPYSSQSEKDLFADLHILGVETFQEENLNFIPEA